MSALPAGVPALYATHAGIWLADGDGVAEVARGEALARAAETPTILLNAPLAAARLGVPELSGLDLLELFAFVHPARFAVPTPAGLARALGLAPPEADGDAAPFLRAAAAHLLRTLGEPDWPEREGAWSTAQALGRARWPWATLVAGTIPRPAENERWLFARLPQWEEAPPRPEPRPVVLGEAETHDRLARLVGHGAEPREGQRAYAAAAARAFDPPLAAGRPQLLLAEAGTGIGKTLGYLAPAALYAAQAGAPVWISTFTKALQRQLATETARLFPDEAERRAKVVIRKGRENYLCLLNLEDALQGGFQGRAAILAQLVARWAAYSRDGDMIGGDLPGWLPNLFRRAGTTALTDRRGECIHAGCPHYRRCFIERVARAADQADLVIANHALAMIVATRAMQEGRALARLVFDEGHHLFDAADATFAVALTGAETIELRRWILGPESRARGRRRGLAARLADVASYDAEGARAIEAAAHAAQALPGDGWLGRLAEGVPHGPIETLLAAARATVFARARAADAGFGIETEAAELDAPLIEATAPAADALEALVRPLAALRQRLGAVLEAAPDWLDSAARARIDGALYGLAHRQGLIGAWIALLARIGGAPDPDFVDWLAVDRVEGREYDVGLHRRWLDPTKPLVEAVVKPAHGLLVTSATLRGGDSWESAEARIGVPHLGHAPAALRGGKPVRLSRPGRDPRRHRSAPRRPCRARRRLCAADRGGGRRCARPVRCDRPAEGGARAHRRSPGARGAAALRAACRSDRHGHARRHVPRRSARQPARHRRAARRGGRARHIAAAGGDGRRAMVAPHRAPCRPQGRHRRRRRPRGSAGPRAAGAGVRPADPARE